MKVAFTGHRPQTMGNYSHHYELQNNIRTQLFHILSGYDRIHPDLKVISGMALGVDQWAALAAMELKLPLICAIPFKGQDRSWPRYEKDTYQYILRYAESNGEIVIVSAGSYAAYKMFKRNEWMVDNCDVLVAVWNGSMGGTGHCVKYAEEQGKPIVRLNPEKINNKIWEEKERKNEHY